jgi:hypothetical protein
MHMQTNPVKNRQASLFPHSFLTALIPTCEETVLGWPITIGAASETNAHLSISVVHEFRVKWAH